MTDLETLESREFGLVGWMIKRHPAFVRIYNADGAVLFTLKRGEFYDNIKDCRFTIKAVKDMLTRDLAKEGSLDKFTTLFVKLEALEYAESLTEKLD